MRKLHILIIDDEPLVRHSLRELLALEGYAVTTACNGKEGVEAAKKSPPDIVLSDMKMPEMDGLHVVREMKKVAPQAKVILATGYGSIEDAVRAMREGAYDYITKPIVDSEIKILIERVADQQRLLAENILLRKQVESVCRDHFLNIVGRDEKMQRIYNLIETVAATRATILIHGESGTGKRLVAHAIHRMSDPEKKLPFVEVSCGALTETLLESELFGHVKGSFTGAIRDRVGRFELAHGGTIFLDEIDAFSLTLQVKLLRVLQEGEFEMVGDTKTRKVDTRIVTATNQDLEELIAQGKFRKDLFYRLNIIAIEIPPLRERKGDIPLLVESFVEKHSRANKKKIERLSPEAMEILQKYDWPGNIRELENVIERATILCKGHEVTPEFLPDAVKRSRKVYADNNGDGDGTLSGLKGALSVPEKDLIVRVLEKNGWNRNSTAEELAINRTTLYKKMVKYGLLEPKRPAKGH